MSKNEHKKNQPRRKRLYERYYKMSGKKKPRHPENDPLYSLERWFDSHNNPKTFFNKASDEQFIEFVQNVEDLMEAYRKSGADLEKYNEYFNKRRLSLQKNAQKASTGTTNKADTYALSINNEFLRAKQELLDNGKKYSDSELARKLTEKKIAPPRGKEGDPWSVNAVQRHEARINKLTQK